VPKRRIASTLVSGWHQAPASKWVALNEPDAVRPGSTLVDDSIETLSVTRLLTVVGLCCGLLESDVIAIQATPVPLAERARGAERVVVGRVASVAPAWHVNEFGDQLIVSKVRVVVNETLKGPAVQALDVEIEGGTIGELTLRVSDQTSFSPGERGVFYLNRTARGTFVPHLRGQGLLKLDASNRVSGSSLTLEEIRREVAVGSAR
jgi:hypothetical protein